MTVKPVTDIRSSPHDQIAHAAEVIGRSAHRRRVFEAIYKGKKKVKTVDELVALTHLPSIRVLQEAGVLSDNHIVHKTKLDKKTAYEKDSFYSRNKKKILRLAGNKEALEKFPTKFNPRREVSVTITVPKAMVDVKQLTVDDIDSFAEVRNVKFSLERIFTPVDEKQFKGGLKKIIGEEGTFQDWGGESDDLFSTRLLLYGNRVNVAFGLKGKGTKGIVVPRKMGKRGDQIQRLLAAPADVFLIQYWGQIDESIIDQMRRLAIAKSWSDRKRIYYGVIDGQDTQRIIQAYKYCFPTNN